MRILLRRVADLKLVVFVLLFFAPLLSWAHEIPPYTSNVVDEAGVLSSADQSLIHEHIESVRNSADIYSAVYIIKSLDGESVEAVAEQTFRKWKLGTKGKDNGVLLIFSINDRRGRIEVGYGLEGSIPDVLAKRTLDEVILPEFKTKNYAQGIADGLDRLAVLQTKGQGVLSTDFGGINPVLGVGSAVVFFCFAMLISFLRRISKRTKVDSVGSFVMRTILDIFLLAPFAAGVGFVALLGPQFIGPKLLKYFELWVVFLILCFLMPLLTRLTGLAIGSREKNKNPDLYLHGFGLALFIFGVTSDLAIGSIIFSGIFMGMAIAIFPTTPLTYGALVAAGSIAIIASCYFTLMPLISAPFYKRMAARGRLNRIRRRVYGTREIFGQTYTYSPSSSSNSSSSDSSSSSDGGSSGGGGASSSW